MEFSIIKTPIGYAKLSGDENGITSFTLVKEEKEETKIPKVLEEAQSQLKDYFEGHRKEFQLQFNPRGTDFQKKVWEELLNIPFGKTISYLELSKRLQNPKAIRAIAAANGKNPLWIFIPCHRVIGSNGDLVGYAGGLSIKKWLLEHESPSKQGKLF